MASEGEGDDAGEETFRSIFEGAVDAIVLANDDAEYVEVNAAACDLFGLARSELIGRTVAEFAADDFDFEAAWEEFRHSDRDRGLFPLVRPDGTERLVEFAASHAIAPGMHLSILRDVTETRQLERELDELLGRVSDAFYALDSEWQFTYVNEQAEAILDRTAADLIGANIWTEFPDAAEGIIHEEYTRAMRTQTPVDFELYYEPLDVWVQINAYPSRTGLSVYFQDISELVTREQQLRESEGRLSMALAASSAGVWEWDIDTDEVVWHESCERLFGLEPGTFEGTYDAFAKRVHPDDLQHVEDRLEATLDRGERFEAEYRIIRDDGIERWIDSHGELVTNGTDQPRKFVGVDVDITERKEREQHLRVFDRVLRHNIRNDLNVISSYAELIADRADGELAEFGQRIHRQSEKLLTTSDKERAIASILTTPATVGRVDVAKHVEQVAEQGRVCHPDATISVEQPATVSAITTDRFGEALAELVENAIVHSDRETPTVDLTVRCTDEHVRIRIADDGPPIPEMNVGVLTGEKEIDPVYHGSGLGLWLVNWIVRRSGGTLSFDENGSRGNVVTLTLPRTASRPDDPATTETDTSAQDRSSTTAAGHRRSETES